MTVRFVNALETIESISYTNIDYTCRFLKQFYFLEKDCFRFVNALATIESVMSVPFEKNKCLEAFHSIP